MPVLHNEKILITGATGKIAFPIARTLAKFNDVLALRASAIRRTRTN
jgi:nucleoside-diphosphate-sugar epimerase